jgi:tetratricopeptide (TPR) repeat protein
MPDLPDLPDHDLPGAAAQGWASASRDDPAPTVRYFERLLDRYPGDALALFHCARAYDYAGIPDKALPLYDQAFAAGLSGDELRRGLTSYGSTLRNLCRYEDAVDALAQAHHKFPDDVLILCYLALGMHSAGRSAPAVALLLDVVLDHVDDPELQANRWALGNYAAALRRGYWSPDGATVPSGAAAP